ncbi:hypothetical protein EAE99_007977 [Botrytis elliptica]|nr:hypothetical protein EAE99_007977 [Botrytis elliptica]
MCVGTGTYWGEKYRADHLLLFHFLQITLLDASPVAKPLQPYYQPTENHTVEREGEAPEWRKASK